MRSRFVLNVTTKSCPPAPLVTRELKMGSIRWNISIIMESVSIALVVANLLPMATGLKTGRSYGIFFVMPQSRNQDNDDFILILVTFERPVVFYFFTHKKALGQRILACVVVYLVECLLASSKNTHASGGSSPRRCRRHTSTRGIPQT